MAQGKKCQNCNYPMYAQREDDQPKGRWVYYVCQNGDCKKKSGGYAYSEKVVEKYRM